MPPYHTRSHCFLLSLVKVSAVTLITSFSASFAQTFEPVLPVTTADQSAGYFPTLTEDILLRGPNDSRSMGYGTPGNAEGPDNRGMTAAGLFRYYDNEPDFYQRNQSFFRPINRGLGMFVPHDAFTVESSSPHHATFSIDGQMGLFSRDFNPELSHIKAGPLHFDVLWLGAGVIYSDYDGDQPLANSDDDDGWAAFVELGVRGILQITDSIFLSLVANVIYLPFENEVALMFGGANTPSLLFRFNLNEQLGEWEVLFFDEFRGVTGLELLVNADSSAIDRAGRYQFGYQTGRSNDFYNSDQAVFVNTIGFYASRPVLEDQWRFGLGIEHSDSWRSFSFDDHRPADRGTVWMQYEGSSVPFNPRLSYEYISNDGYRSMLHMFRLLLRGRLTENIGWAGMAGYALSSGDTIERDQYIWNIELDHNITMNTRHMLSLGEDYFYNEFTTDTFVSRYVRYTIEQRFTNRFTSRAFVQYANDERSVSQRFPVRDRFGAGLMLSYRPLDFTDISGLVFYDQADISIADDDSSRWLYRIDITQQLGHRLTGNLFYQYEDFGQQGSAFREHYMGVSLRRYF